MTVVIGYDGSDAARDAVRGAGALLAPRRAVVVYVRPPAIDPVPPAAPGVVLPPAAAPERDEAEARRSGLRVAREGAALAEAAGLDAVAEVQEGNGASAVAAMILRVADAHDAELVVVGGRGRSGLLAALLSSVADDVVHRATRPVLVVPCARA